MTSVPPPSKTPSSTRSVSGLTMALLVMTTLAGLVALALLWAAQWGIVHTAGGSINDARRAALATPLFWTGVTLIAALWIALWRWLHWRAILVPIVMTLVAASLAGVFFWRSQTVTQPIAITTWTCTSGEHPVPETTDQLLGNCTKQALDTQLAFGSFTDRTAFAPVNDGARYEFNELPVGIYHGELTTTAPLETASIVLAAESNGTITPRRTLGIGDPFGDASRTWSTQVNLRPKEDSYLLIYYLSGKPALPNARITFTVEQCSTTSPATFDPTGCQPITADDQLLAETSTGTGPATFRQPTRTREGSTIVYSNLEERTYRFTPITGNQPMTTSSHGVLVVPSDGPQTLGANVLTLSPESRQEEFNVKITPDSGTISYTIYLFPAPNIYAAMPAPGQAVATGGAISHHD